MKHECLLIFSLYHSPNPTSQIDVYGAVRSCAELPVGSLLTDRHIRVQLHSATARHEHEAKRNANGTARQLEVYRVLLPVVTTKYYRLWVQVYDLLCYTQRYLFLWVQAHVFLCYTQRYLFLWVQMHDFLFYTQ